MSITQEQPVNGHTGHELTNLVPFQPVPIRSSLDPATPDTNSDQGEQRPVSPPPVAASAPAPPALRTEEPPLPEKPAQPEFPLRTLQAVGLVMAVAMSAVGQVLFWRDFFGGGATALAGAIAIASAFEVLMIGATDMSLHHKTTGSPWWLLLFPIGASAAGVAAIVQLLHWPPEMGIPFAAASTLGWAAHAVSGWVRAQHYRTAIAEYTADVDRRRRKAEDRETAEYERYLADVETQRQATQRAVHSVTPTEPKPEKPAKAASGKKTTPAKSTGRKAAAAPELTPELAREWSDANDGATASQVIAHFKQQGYQLKEPRTVRRWLNDR